MEGKQDKTGTLYRRNRSYDPQAGRFTQEDPIGLAGGVNLYGFAAGDPVNFRDPFGLNPCQDNPAACALVLEGVAAINPLLALAVIGGAIVLSQPEVQEGAVELGVAAREGLTQVVKSVRSTLRKIGNAIAITVGIGTGDQVPQIEQEPPPPPGKNAPPPPGTGKSPIEFGRDGTPRMRIPVDP